MDENEILETLDFEALVEQRSDELTELLDGRDMKQLKRRMEELNEFDVAAFLAGIEDNRMPMVFRLLSKETAAEVFANLEAPDQERIINSITDSELGSILDELYLDDAVDIIEEMPASVVIRILERAAPEMRKAMNEILQYPEDSAGSIMNMEFLSLKKDMTVADAFKRIRRIGGDMETINILYVTDPQRKLLGVLSVRDLLLAEEDDLIEDLMDPDLIWATTMDDKEDVAQALSRYDFLAMPVVDKEGRLVGIVTVDDVIDYSDRTFPAGPG